MRWARCWYSSRRPDRAVDRADSGPHGPAARARLLEQALIPNHPVAVGAARFGNDLPLALIAGPCQLESRAHALEMASALKEIAARLKIGLVYQTSFDN